MARQTARRELSLGNSADVAYLPASAIGFCALHHACSASKANCGIKYFIVPDLSGSTVRRRSLRRTFFQQRFPRFT
jgi:hypothetical protein